MVTLLKLWNRATRDVETQEPALEAAAPAASVERLYMLVPEGGFSYRLFTFPTLEEAEEYAGSHSLQLPRTGIVTFWAADPDTAASHGASTNGAAEAVVMIRNPNAPAAVQLYTFTDMEGAYSFVRDSMAGGLDPNLVLLHWAELVSLDVPIATRTEPTKVKPTPVRPSALPESAHRAERVQGTREEAAEAAAPAAKQDTQRQPADEAGAGWPLARAVGRVYDWHGWDGLLARMMAATLLKPDVYDLIRRDPAAKGRAVFIVGLGAFAAGLGALDSGLFAAFWQIVAGLAGWAAFAGTAYVVGVHFFGGRRMRGEEFFKAAGLASSVAVLLIFGAVPVFGPLFVLAVSVWMAVATATALMCVLELERDPALLSATMGWFGFFAIAQVGPLLLLG